MERDQVKRIIVAGGRDFSDYPFLREKMDEILKTLDGDAEIISGHAAGADLLGERYAIERCLLLKVMPADWESNGKAAGVLRNQQMLDYALGAEPMVVAFWDGKSRGTRDMIDRARRQGTDTRIFLY